MDMPTRPIIDPETHEICALCGSEKDDVHHIDGDRSNNNLKNKLPVCSSCQSGIHYGYEPKHLPWYIQLDPGARHSNLPRVGRQREAKKHTRARVMHERLTKAFTAADTAFEEAPERGHDFDLALGIQRGSFFYDFRLLSVSKKWGEGHYEFRPFPIVLEETDHHGYVVRLPPFDVSEDSGPTLEAYAEFADVVNTGTSYTVGPPTLADGQSLSKESSHRRTAVNTRPYFNGT